MCLVDSMLLQCSKYLHSRITLCVMEDELIELDFQRYERSKYSYLQLINLE